MQLVWFLRLANVFLIVFLSNITFVTPQDIITDPGISVAVIGDKVEMNCSENRYFLWVYTSWKYTSWNTSTEIYLDADDNSMRSRYKIDTRSNGQHNLIIDSVDLAHAGRYRCTSGLRHTLRTDIQLIVLGSDPVCAANISAAKNDGREQNHLYLWCSINYTGNRHPVFRWTKGNTKTRIAANTTTFGSSLFSKTSLVIQQLHDTDRGVEFRCQITFKSPFISERVYTWSHTLPSRAQDSGVTSGVSNSHIGLTTLAIAGSLLALLIITVAFACVVHRKRLRGDSNVRLDVALNTDLNSYGPSGDVNSDNEVYTDVCKPRGSSDGVNCDNEVYSEVCDHRGSDSISDSEFYAVVCPSNVSKGSSFGDNSRPPQIPIRERKDFIRADGTEHVELREVKPPGRKEGKYMKSVMW